MTIGRLLLACAAISLTATIPPGYAALLIRITLRPRRSAVAGVGVCLAGKRGRIRAGVAF
jgi:hypothetical protein